MKTMYKIFTLLLAVGLTVTACDNNELFQEKAEPAVITLSLNNVQTRGGNLFADGNLITKVRIYVFNGNYLDAKQVYTSGTNEFKNPFTIKTTTGPKTVYVVANEPADMTATLEGVTTLSQLKNVVTFPVNPGTLNKPLSMVGSENAEVIPVVEPNDPTVVKVKLTRLVARINLKLKKGNTPYDIILKSVRLIRGPEKSALIEGQTVTEQTYGNYTYTGQGEYALTTAGVDAWTGATPMYVYENPGSAADSVLRATYLIIDARYNGIDTRYKAYVNDKTATFSNGNATDHPYSIKRNHMYNIEATITNIGEFNGVTLSTYVMPWNLLQSELTYDRIYETSLDPQPTPNNKNYTLKEITDQLTFTFTITNPYGAAWTTQFTNPDYFDATVTPGTSPYGLGTYTITISPKHAPTTEERVTEFYINVGWTGSATGFVEIPLLAGTPLIGNGYRIVITQEATTP
ncbi:MAG: fimbrial protein [Proteiniphilum sp.]|nr:fimbrial protein [Proteiniphilum sp.]MDD3908821.1 fimbrial protein [Proteiniphilum sp.]